MRTVDHPNIIKLHEVYEDEKYMHIVTEIYTGLDLFDDIMEQDRYDEQKAGKKMHLIFSAVNYLHH